MIEHDNVVYFYRTEKLMISALTDIGYGQKMQMADHAVGLQKDRIWCTVIKDRSGMFHNQSTFLFKKFVKIVKVLMED